MRPLIRASKQRRARLTSFAQHRTELDPVYYRLEQISSSGIGQQPLPHVLGGGVMEFWTEPQMASIHKMLNPRSIAIVGATPRLQYGGGVFGGGRTGDKR